MENRIFIQKKSNVNIYDNNVKFLCGDLSNPIEVVIEDTYLTNQIFTRDGETWYMLHTRNKFTVCVNLDTGETRKIRSLNFWRGKIQISPNGKLAVITAGITASSWCQILVVDLYDWDNVTVIHREEIFIDFEVRFDDDDNNVIFEYLFDFRILDDQVSLVYGDNEEKFSKYLWEVTNVDKQIEEMPKYYSASSEELLSAGGEETTIKVTLTRKRNPSLISPDRTEKWDSKKNKKIYQSYITLDEMEIIKTEKQKIIKTKRNNIQVNELNFEEYLN